MCPPHTKNIMPKHLPPVPTLNLKRYNLRKRKTPDPPPADSSSDDESNADDSDKEFLDMLNSVCHPKLPKVLQNTSSINIDTSDTEESISDTEEECVSDTKKSLLESEESISNTYTVTSESVHNTSTVSSPKNKPKIIPSNTPIVININTNGLGNGDNDSECDSDYEEDDDKTNDSEFNSDDETRFIHKNMCPPPADSTSESEVIMDIEPEYERLLKNYEMVKEKLTQTLSKKKSNLLNNEMNDYKTQMREIAKDARRNNLKTYDKMIHRSSKQMNEIDYFKTHLTNKEQLHLMSEMHEINKHLCVEKPYRVMLLETNIPPKFKAIAMQKLNMLKSMGKNNSEYYKLKHWVDTFIKIPFGIYRNLNIHISDGLDVCNTFMQNAKQTLDTCVYGMDDAKLQIMQMLGQWIANPKSMGTAIAIHGPPGTGKTSIVKDGISKILGREFAFITLGGSSDSSFLEGHSYTYEGSSWGKIVQILIESKSMNPVIYFDELDKVSETSRGQEIIGVLTHLTDTTQNMNYHDKYFSEVDFDLSKALFIFSYNDESMVNPILKDRMYHIRTNGYDTKDKIVIAQKYIIPKICEQVNMPLDYIIIPDDTLTYIIQSNSLTKGENGVRNLKRCLEIIYTKLNLFRIVKSDNEILKPYGDLNVSFPFTVSRKTVDSLIRKNEPVNLTLLSMYI